MEIAGSTLIRSDASNLNQVANLPCAQCMIYQLCERPPQYAPAPCKLTFDLLTLKVVSESHVIPATSVLILVFLGLSVLDLGPMYATDRRQTSDAHHRLMSLT